MVNVYSVTREDVKIHDTLKFVKCNLKKIGTPMLV